jgi:hypothetical protein
MRTTLFAHARDRTSGRNGDARPARVNHITRSAGPSVKRVRLGNLSRQGRRSAGRPAEDIVAKARDEVEVFRMSASSSSCLGAKVLAIKHCFTTATCCNNFSHGKAWRGHICLFLWWVKQILQKQYRRTHSIWNTVRRLRFIMYHILKNSSFEAWATHQLREPILKIIIPSGLRRPFACMVC